MGHDFATLKKLHKMVDFINELDSVRLAVGYYWQ